MRHKSRARQLILVYKNFEKSNTDFKSGPSYFLVEITITPVVKNILAKKFKIGKKKTILVR